MKRYHAISYPLDEKAPLFPGNPPLVIDSVHSFQKGDRCSTALVTIFGHNGTHIDAPGHYREGGRALCDFEVEDLVFMRPFLAEVAKRENERISSSDLMSAGIPEDADLLLLRTGFFSRRDHPSYKKGPVLAVEAARFLRSGFPQLRAIGIDYLSLTNPVERAVGEEVHRILLDETIDREPVLIIEDMDLSRNDTIGDFLRVFVVPLYVDGVDGFPCTVFGEYEDGR